MSKVDRLVVNFKVPQILEFRRGLFPKISYDYLQEPRVKKRCPMGTRLVKSKSCDEKINSVIGFGQGAFFLLGNEDKHRLGKAHLGFIDSFGRYSLSNLGDSVSLDNSFFLDVYNSQSKCNKKSEPHLLLAHTYSGGFTSLHGLEFGKTDLGECKFRTNKDDLVWSENFESYLIMERDGNFLDSDGIIVNKFIWGDALKGSFSEKPISGVHHASESLSDKLVHSPNYETFF